MPQRKKRTIIDEEIPAENVSVNDDLADFVIVNTKVYKVNAGEKSFCFQAQEPVDEVYIQQQYPTGGKFVVVELNAMNQQVRVQHINIEPRPLPATTNGGGDIQTRLLLDELSYSRAMMLKMIEGMFNSRQQHAEQTPIGELITAVTGLHNMTAPKIDAAELILKGMDLGIKANGGNAAGDWKAELVTAAKEVLPAAIGAMQVRQPTTQQQQISMVQTTPAALVKQGIEWLKPRIISGMGPDLAVGWVIQNNADPLCQQLIAQAIQGDINSFIQFDAEISNEPYKTWFTNAILQLKEWYAEQQGATENDNDGGIGDGPDTPSDAVVSIGKSKVTKIG